jgi:hypothetical protein
MMLGEATMAKTLKAAVGHEFKQPLSIEEVPEVGPGQILVKIDLRAGMVGGATANALLFRRWWTRSCSSMRSLIM